MDLSSLLQKKKSQLKTNEEGILFRTKDGQIFKERLIDGQLVKELIKTEFVLIEGAPDPEVRQQIFTNNIR
jgi:hypothetical protein